MKSEEVAKLVSAGWVDKKKGRYFTRTIECQNGPVSLTLTPQKSGPPRLTLSAAMTCEGL
ncbi:hypothetical protein KIPB_010480, partial [Kipferlia bialata]|eukprot:g10480.t1